MSYRNRILLVVIVATAAALVLTHNNSEQGRASSEASSTEAQPTPAPDGGSLLTEDTVAQTRGLVSGHPLPIIVYIDGVCLTSGPFDVVLSDHAGNSIQVKQVDAGGGPIELQPHELGRHEVKAERAGWQSDVKSLSVGSAGANAVALTPQPLVAVSGRVVRDGDGVPIQDYDVRLECRFAQDDMQARVVNSIVPCKSVDGRFCVAEEDLRAQEVRACIVAKGYASACSDWWPITSSQIELPIVVLQVHMEGVINGTVRDSSGEPVPGVQVSTLECDTEYRQVVTNSAIAFVRAGVRTASSSDAGKQALDSSGVVLATSDAQGRFSATVGVPGRIVVAAWKPGYQVWKSEPVRLSESQRDVVVNPALVRSGKVELRIVTEPHGAVIVDVEQVRCEGQHLSLVVDAPLADDAGVQTVEIDSIAEGLYTLKLMARHGGRAGGDGHALLTVASEQIRCVGATTQHSIYLGRESRGGMITGTLQCPADVPWSGVSVLVESSGRAGAFLRESWPSDAGEVRVSNVPPGLYDVIAVGLSQDRSMLCVSMHTRVAIQDDLHELFGAPLGQPVRIAVNNPDGSPAVGKLIRLNGTAVDVAAQALRGRLAAVVGSGGTIVIYGVPAGLYDIDIAGTARRAQVMIAPGSDLVVRPE